MENEHVYNIRRLSSENDPVDRMVEIVERAKTGDMEAFAELYKENHQKLYEFIYRRTGHKEVAEDLTEDVFVKANHKIKSLAESKSFRGWLYTIARNTIIDYYRSKKTDIPLDDIAATLQYDQNIVEQANLHTEHQLLLEVLYALPPDQQMIIKLKFLENLDNAEIAELLDKKEGAIRVLQHRAIQKLQELIHKRINRS